MMWHRVFYYNLVKILNETAVTTFTNDKARTSLKNAIINMSILIYLFIHLSIHSVRINSYVRSTVSYKASSPQSAI
jgi:hypothetical protein